MNQPQNPYVVPGFGSGVFGNPPIEYLTLSYYMGLLTSQYDNSPKLNAFLLALLKKFDDISQVQMAMDMAFDLDNARGVQLDILGVILGAPRTVGFQPSAGVSPVLDDVTYRIYLKARAAQNQWDGTMNGLELIWMALFPSGRIIVDDAQNMTVSLIISGAFTSILKDLIVNGYILPRPQAVLYTYIFPRFPMFGCDLNNSFIAGFDTGYMT